MKTINLYTDGSCLGNPGAGGYCAILRFKDKEGLDHEKIVKGAQVLTTNNQMELLAVIEGLKALKEPCQVHILSDSTYVVKGINEWLKGWIKKDFKKIKNEDLWRSYIKVSQSHDVHIAWIKAHNGHEGNEMCDKIAREQALLISSSS